MYFPHSLGIFYQAITQYLGFPHYGDEYKVMGLAPYGKPTVMDAMRQIVHLKSDGSFELNLKYFRHDKERISYQWASGSPEFADLFAPALEDLLGPRRSPTDPLEDRQRDIARSAQAMYEEAFFHLIEMLQERSGSEKYRAGGRLRNELSRQRQDSTADGLSPRLRAGGCRRCRWRHRRGGDRLAQPWGKAPIRHGPRLLGTGVRSGRDRERHQRNTRMRSDAPAVPSTEITEEEELCRRTASAIADGKVVGWFQGRMEWGPRALGNRSILCDPRRSDMKAILNAKIKRRELFRPFAPSVLEEAVSRLVRGRR